MEEMNHEISQWVQLSPARIRSEYLYRFNLSK
jgi:hypothetical protein